ncbi:hypothetical protein AGMMS49942_09260 [Spirochaetia bacterium]|nr:hypothetical protein AGMMS49942_09260 [Spirochaetia bacterium]
MAVATEIPMVTFFSFPGCRGCTAAGDGGGDGAGDGNACGTGVLGEQDRRVVMRKMTTKGFKRGIFTPWVLLCSMVPLV